MDGLLVLLPVDRPARRAVAEELEHRGNDESPDDNGQRPGDDGDRDGPANPEVRGVHLLHDAEELQAHEQEDEAFQSELDGVPVGARGHPVGRRQHPRTPVTGDESGDDRGH